MIVAIGSDHAGYELKEKIKAKLIEEGYEILDVGTDSAESVDYPIYGKKIGEYVQAQADAVMVAGEGDTVSFDKVEHVEAPNLEPVPNRKLEETSTEPKRRTRRNREE